MERKRRKKREGGRERGDRKWGRKVDLTKSSDCELK